MFNFELPTCTTMVAKFYYNTVNISSRAVLLTIKALNLQLDMQEIDLNGNDTIVKNIIRINPFQRSLPILMDDQLVIGDCHAISTYLVSKYGNGSNLYPTDITSRALVDEKLYFNSNLLLSKLDDILLSIAHGEKIISRDKIDAIKKGYDLLNNCLQVNAFLVGEHITLADLCCVASISTASIFLPICMEIYPDLFAWYQKCKALPYYVEANGIGLNKLDAFIEEKFNSAFSKSNTYNKFLAYT